MAAVGVVYGVVAYVLFLAVLLSAIGFVGNFGLGKTIDRGAVVPLTEALVVNLLLLGLFALQHSVMARPAFKRWCTRVVPEPMERSTFVLATTVALAFLMLQWRPIPQPVAWAVDHQALVVALEAAFWLGWSLVLGCMFLTDHFEMCGLRQVLAHRHGQALPAPEFRTPALYRHVRHPICLGFLLAIWATPDMTAGHLLFAVGTTAYIFLGTYLKERDLVAQFGDRYRLYRKEVGMLLPRRGRASRRGTSFSPTRPHRREGGHVTGD